MLAPLVVTFIGVYALGRTSEGERGSVFEAAVATIMFGFGPFAGFIAGFFMDRLAGLVLLGVLDWWVIALLVLKTRAGNGHWLWYAGVSSAWLAIGWVVLSLPGPDA